MIGDEEYNRIRKVQEFLKSQLASPDLTSKQRESLELSFAIGNAMLEIQALPKEASEEEFLAKAKVVANLQQKGLELGLLIPGPEKQ
jgi:hypothetical protein